MTTKKKFFLIGKYILVFTVKLVDDVLLQFWAEMGNSKLGVELFSHSSNGSILILIDNKQIQIIRIPCAYLLMCCRQLKALC